jgi:hypothetical protein
MRVLASNEVAAPPYLNAADNAGQRVLEEHAHASASKPDTLELINLMVRLIERRAPNGVQTFPLLSARTRHFGMHHPEERRGVCVRAGSQTPRYWLSI